MEQHALQVIEQTQSGSEDGSLSFPQVVGMLLGVGVSSYHKDFLRSEITYYLQDGSSHVSKLPLPNEPVAPHFDAGAVAAAVKAAQGGLPFPQFLRRILQAGCTGYTAYLQGERVSYAGALGDVYTEYFPGSRFAPAK
jgi:uncharacterized protein YbcV (DUF1398 family)